MIYGAIIKKKKIIDSNAISVQAEEAHIENGP